MRRQSWLSNVFKLLITHLQLLGLLRAVRMDWPSGIDKLMAAMDQTQSISSWVVTECLFAQAGARLRLSIVHTLSILLLPVFAALLGCLFWGCRTLYKAARRRRAVAAATVGPSNPVTWVHYQARIVMTLGVAIFYLYPTVSSAVVSILFGCTPADDPSRVDLAFPPPPGAPPSPDGGALAALKAVGTFWDQDSAGCWEGPMRWLLGMGIAWAMLFCAGFPALMAADLKYGFFYDSYRPKFYFFESVILLKKLAVVVVLTATSRLSAAPQVLSAQCVMFLALLLQLWCRPYACQLLNRLQVLSLVVLIGTTFALMAPALNQALSPGLGANSQQSVAVTAAALSVAGALNLAVIAAFVYHLVQEGRRMVVSALDKQGKGRVTLADAKAFLAGVVRAAGEWSGGCTRAHPAAGHSPAG